MKVATLIVNTLFLVCSVQAAKETRRLQQPADNEERQGGRNGKRSDDSSSSDEGGMNERRFVFGHAPSNLFFRADPLNPNSELTCTTTIPERCAGDLLVGSNNPLFNEKEDALASAVGGNVAKDGSLSAFCASPSPGENHCIITMSFEEGKIMLQGVFDFSLIGSEVAVVGGTGGYSKISGYAKFELVQNPQGQFVSQYEFFL